VKRTQHNPTPATSPAPRRLFGAITDAIRSVVTPATLVREHAPTEPITAPEPADLYTEDELPELADIEAAAREYERAAIEARRADRGKRAARKVLDRLPVGLYGGWLVSRKPAARKVADLEEITRIFKAHGLGPVPMKTCAPSLTVTRTEITTAVTA